nr:hypothetical protein [Tanacetum cinerariifolium]
MDHNGRGCDFLKMEIAKGSDSVKYPGDSAVGDTAAGSGCSSAGSISSAVGDTAAGSGCSSAGSISSAGGKYSGYSGP